MQKCSQVAVNADFTIDRMRFCTTGKSVRDPAYIVFKS